MAAGSPRSPIVLIEDNPADVALFRWTLMEHDIKVEIEVISHGEVAMAFAMQVGGFSNEPPPSLVLIDIGLPGHDGLQVLGAIQKNPVFCRTEVGIYSASDDPRDRKRAMEMGADFFIEKPVDLPGVRALAGRVAELLRVSLGSPGQA
jgi:DNA-binding response OmpR family regulator